MFKKSKNKIEMTNITYQVNVTRPFVCTPVMGSIAVTAIELPSTGEGVLVMQYEVLPFGRQALIYYGFDFFELLNVLRLSVVSVLHSLYAR